MAVQHETSEASLRKRHQEALNELTDQLEQSNKHRAKSVLVCFIIACQKIGTVEIYFIQHNSSV